MSFLFGSKLPPQPAVGQTPEQLAIQRAQMEQIRASRGRASTVLSGAASAFPQPTASTGVKRLLGT